jgi:hypothetical protein
MLERLWQLALLACHRTAIERDGESCCLKDLWTGEVAGVETGAAKAKRQFLERLDWAVANADC